MHVIAIFTLAIEPRQGYFALDQVLQEDQRREPDLEEAFRLCLEGARLRHNDGCCGPLLGHCYIHGQGIEESHTKGFKWLEKKQQKYVIPFGIKHCAHCYILGKGVVEQSTEQAIYWYDNYLELEDDEEIRSVLQNLHDRGSLPYYLQAQALLSLNIYASRTEFFIA